MKRYVENSVQKSFYDAEEYFSLSGIPFYINENFDATSPTMHSHEFTEMVIITGGTAIHETDYGKYLIRRGDTFALMVGQKHNYTDLKQFSYFNFLFDMEWLNPALGDVSALPGFKAIFDLEPRLREGQGFRARLNLDNSAMTHVEDISKILRREISEKLPGYKEVCQSYMVALCAFLGRRYQNMESRESMAVMRMARVLAYIDENFCNEIRLEDLQEIGHISQRHLIRMFSNATGYTPVHYILNKRLEKAVSLLKNSNKPITQISAECGFSDSNYFSRKFKEKMGVTPRSSRKHSTS